MSFLPHTGELALLAAVILIIFGLGRLPLISETLARRIVAGRDAKAGKSSDGD